MWCNSDYYIVNTAIYWAYGVKIVNRRSFPSSTLYKLTHILTVYDLFCVTGLLYFLSVKICNKCSYLLYFSGGAATQIRPERQLQICALIIADFNGKHEAQPMLTNPRDAMLKCIKHLRSNYLLISIQIYILNKLHIVNERIPTHFNLSGE